MDNKIVEVIFFYFYFFHQTVFLYLNFFFFSSRRRHTIFKCDWSSDVCSSDLTPLVVEHDGRRQVIATGMKKIKSYDLDSGARSEERRVGKECRSRWSAYH